MVTEPDVRDQFRFIVENRRVVFGGAPTIAQALAFIAGFNVATGYSLLRGFEEWLVVRLGGGYNIHWYGLVRSLALGIGPWDEPAADLGHEDEEAAAIRIFEAVIDFLGTMDDPSARRGVLSSYERLLEADGLAPDPDRGT